ncbi:uncharacterized protein tp53i13 [Pagrus major]|uniref:uncharacterized protein tp53i13 n=1 Tax=Pagrus major TaxID=143350 RepID=UPI003CC8DBFF
MPSQTRSQPLTVTVLAALWVSLGRCDVSKPLGPVCDNGKLYLGRDLPKDAVYLNCPVSPWPESTQMFPSIDTVYDPEPARQICMDRSISYNHTIPNSGAYRPVRAESGEYSYCPPQRWLNNLHHAATVLLYHPCAPLHERLLLSVLARSCLLDYIITPHPQLNNHTLIALVSWGHTLELSTVASSDVCDWLETTSSPRNKFDAVSQSRKYNLLLTWSAEQPGERPAKMKGSLRRCCEQTISSLLSGEMESNMKKESLEPMKGKSRQIRAAIKDKWENVKDVNKTEGTLTNVSTITTPSSTEDIQSNNSKSGPGDRTLSDPPGPRGNPSQSHIQNVNQDPTTPLGLSMSETNPNPSPGLDVAVSVNSEHDLTAMPEVLSPQDEGTDSVHPPMEESGSKDKHYDKDHTADGMMKDNEVVDVKERELEHKQTHSDAHSHHKDEKAAFDSVSKSQSESPPQPASYLPSSRDCDGCKEGERCECNKDSGAEAQASLVNSGLPRTPRTDEAVWAAAALGFLLVLLTLSVLHTRLYRHWRTTPSLYWHDPQLDYDSVADVIRRRLRIVKKRRKRGRRQECVLLPSSSSSDEHP